MIMTTPLDYNIVTETIDSLGLGDFSQATIRDIQTLSRVLEEKTGDRVIHLEMGVPGLKPSEIALNAEREALASGVATQYPPNGGIPRIKNASSQFVIYILFLEIRWDPNNAMLEGQYHPQPNMTRHFINVHREVILG